jgi:hypothetical protein
MGKGEVQRKPSLVLQTCFLPSPLASLASEAAGNICIAAPYPRAQGKTRECHFLNRGKIAMVLGRFRVGVLALSVEDFQVGARVFMEGFTHFCLLFLVLCKDDERDLIITD